MPLHPDPLITTGKQKTPSILTQGPGVKPSKDQLRNAGVCVSSVNPTGDYRLFGAVNEVQMSIGYKSSSYTVMTGHLASCCSKEPNGTIALVSTEIGQC